MLTALAALPAFLLWSTGCGTNIEEILRQTVFAAGRTYFDLVLTDVANDLADAFEQADESDVPDDGADDGDRAPDDGGGADFGDAAVGERFFADNGCGACHGANANDGFAPSLVGAEAGLLLDKMNGTVDHPGGVTDGVTVQDAADLAAWLETL